MDQLEKRPPMEGEEAVLNVQEHRIPCLLNFSACQLKVKGYNEAADACSEVSAISKPKITSSRLFMSTHATDG